MATKMRCPRCDGRKYIEKEAGLIQEECPECAVPNADYQNGNDVFTTKGSGDIVEPITSKPDTVGGKNAEADSTGGITKRPDTGSDTGTSGSDKGKAAGNRQPKGKKAKRKVRKGT